MFHAEPSAPSNPSNDKGVLSPVLPCCRCKPISLIKIISVKFMSDHDVLINYDEGWRNWTKKSGRFPKPEWTATDQHPVSHSMDFPMTIELTIDVSPGDACPVEGILRGQGPVDLVFEKKPITFKPGKTTLTLRSSKRLPKKIQELDFKVYWTAVGNKSELGAPGLLAVTPSHTENTVFVTLDTPSTPEESPGITLRRMRQAVRHAGAAGSIEPHAIVSHVMSKWPHYNPNRGLSNAWLLAKDEKDPDTGELIAADCQTIVRYVRNVIMMVGCPGDAEFIVVWAKVKTPDKGEVNPGPTPNVVEPAQFRDPRVSSIIAGLADRDLVLNKFEACLRFTHPAGSQAAGDTKYYAGGVEGGVFDHPNEVIQVFSALVWFDRWTADIVDFIYHY